MKKEEIKGLPPEKEREIENAGKADFESGLAKYIIDEDTGEEIGIEYAYDKLKPKTKTTGGWEQYGGDSGGMSKIKPGRKNFKDFSNEKKVVKSTILNSKGEYFVKNSSSSAK